MFISTASLLFTALLATAAPHPIVGTWESVTTSMGGIGSTLEFAADGSARSTIGAMVDFTYSATSTELTTVFVDPKGRREEHKDEIRVTPTTLVEKQGNGPGKDLEMKRVGPPPSTATIVGTWTYPHSTGATAFETFTPDGRMLLRIPLRTERGAWSADGSRLRTSFPGRAEQTFAYAIDKDVLSLKSTDGHETKYKRAH